MTKRIVAYLLTILMLFTPVMTACTEKPDGADTGTGINTSVPSGSDEEITESTVTETEINDNLGEHDLKEYEFKILSPDPNSMTWLNPLINSDELTGEPINDAIYQRNREIEERFKMKFTETYGSWDIGVNQMRTTVNAGDNAYDMITMVDRFALSCYTEGLIKSYSEIPNIDLTKPYWNPSMFDYMSIHGKNVFAYGDFNISLYDATIVMLFNKDVVKTFNLESPYELVSTGKWTFDKFSEMSLAVTSDIDGNTIMDDKDRYGYLAMPKQVLPNFWISAGELSITKNEADEPKYTIPTDENFYNVINKIFAITRDNGTWYQNKIDSDNDLTLETLFTSGNSLFLDSSYKKLIRLRDMDSDFGIIPYPKLDEAQSSYYTRHPGANFAVLPITNVNIETAGIVLEALASHSRKTVIPTYYDIALKTKFSRDEDSRAMLDIISNTRVYDLGDTYWCEDIRDGFLKSMFTNDRRDLISESSKIEKSFSKKLAKATDTFK